MARQDTLAPHILACAILQAFPTSKLIGGGSTPLHFYYNVVFDFVFTKDAVQAIQSALNHLLSAPESMKLMEMIPSNAADLLKHHRQEVRSEVAKDDPNQLVAVLKVGDCYDYAAQAFSVDLTYECAHIISFEEVSSWDGKPILQIVGVGAPSHRLLNEKKKHLKGALKRRHTVLGRKMGLFDIDEDEQVYWHERGEGVRQILEREWRYCVQKLGVDVIATPSLLPFSSRFDSYQQLFSQKKRIAQFGSVEREYNTSDVLFSGGIVRGDLIRFVGSRKTIENDLNSSLKMVCDFWRKCCLTKGACVHIDFETLLKNEGAVELRAADVFGRSQKISTLCLQELKKGLFELNVRVFWNLSAFVALTIEKNGSNLPFFLEPIQVHIVVFKKKLIDHALAYQKKLESNQIRVHFSEEVVSQKHEAMTLAKKKHSYYFLALKDEENGYLLKGENKKFDSVVLKDFTKCVLMDAKKS